MDIDVDATIAAILQTFHAKVVAAASAPPERASLLIEETQRRIMLVYYSAISQTNDHLTEYLPPLELSD